jgi:hypothetical protein
VGDCDTILPLHDGVGNAYHSISLGKLAMNPCNDAGGENTAVGFQALNAHDSGVGNTAMGCNALVLQAGTFKDYSTALGYRALEKNNVAASTAVGAYALAINTTGTRNTAVGTYALEKNVTASNNTAFGTSALSKLYTGDGCTAIGHNAAANTAQGGNTTAVGSYAHFNASGQDNTVIGANALADGYGTISSVTAVGANAAKKNRANGTTAIGFEALAAMTTGAENTAVGTLSMKLQTIGEANVAVGTNALQYFIDGSRNVAVGANCGTTYSSNVLTDSVMLGNNASSTQSNSIAIGSSAVAAPLVNANSLVNVGGTGTVSLGSKDSSSGGRLAVLQDDTGAKLESSGKYYLPVNINGQQFFLPLWQNVPA